MAVVISPTPDPITSSSPFSISKFIAKLKLRRSSKQKDQIQDEISHDPRPPLIPSPLPLVLPEHQHTLCQLGWTTLTFPSSSSHPSHHSSPTSNREPEPEPEPEPGPHPLQSAYLTLFLAAQQFFDLEDEKKQQWKHRLGTEEGWTKIRGEKEFITLRTLAYTPDILKEPAKRYWDLMGSHLCSTLGRISMSVGLPGEGEGDGLKGFVGPCNVMGEKEEDKTSTMLRIFRYESWERKIVAEAHADLGLLSCVVGDVPGLEVWNGQQFVDIERLYERERIRKGTNGVGGINGDRAGFGGKATLLSGRQLERFSNFRYPAGGHRVVSYGLPSPPSSKSLSAHTPVPNEAERKEKKYRHSIVFVLRAHEPTPVNSSTLETEITGKWAEPIRDVTAGELYERIRNQHFNVNIGHEEREAQRRRVREAKANGKSVEGTG